MIKKLVPLVICTVFILALFSSTKSRLEETNNTTLIIDYINIHEEEWNKTLNQSEVVNIINQTINRIITLPNMSKYYNRSKVDELLAKKEENISNLQSQVDSLRSNITKLKSLIEEQKSLIQEQKEMIETQRAVMRALESALFGEVNKTSKIAKALEEGGRIEYNETTGEIIVTKAKPWYYQIGAWFKGLFRF